MVSVEARHQALRGRTQEQMDVIGMRVTHRLSVFGYLFVKVLIVVVALQRLHIHQPEIIVEGADDVAHLLDHCASRQNSIFIRCPQKLTMSVEPRSLDINT